MRIKILNFQVSNSDDDRLTIEIIRFDEKILQETGVKSWILRWKGKVLSFDNLNIL
jgi:hypothetical protein